MTTAGVSIHPLIGLGEIRPGDDLAALLAGALGAAGLFPSTADILVVTSKIVSKAEGRFVDLATVQPGARARELAGITGKDARLVEVVLSESVTVLRAVPNVLITRHRLGAIMANAGIDQSNIGPDGGDRVLLLPLDPDASAARIRRALADSAGHGPAVVISDSFGRPWRQGVVNVAIGASGLPSLVDRRGDVDRDGRILEVTQIAFADLLATAAGLVTGEGAESVPAALIKGLAPQDGDSPASALVRPADQDLFL